MTTTIAETEIARLEAEATRLEAIATSGDVFAQIWDGAGATIARAAAQHWRDHGCPPPACDYAEDWGCYVHGK